MTILTKCRYILSSFYKQKKPHEVPQPQKTLSPPPLTGGDTVASQAMKRIPLIKFPKRHPKPSGSATQTLAVPAASNVSSTFFSRSAPSEKTLGGKASLQPKRTPMTQEEIDAILLGGCL
ncbi:hypothetical protein HanIR_Chr13g0656271 [Helianthus annuus]|nr:hypothetical protein HanIR_Chr13g0656271 [Helianthus annuus]